MGTRTTLAAALILNLGLLQACANPEAAQASRQAVEADAQTKDEAKCRENGLEPGTPAYDNCRTRIAQARYDEAVAQERRRMDFQKTLGAGTSDATGH
ncbi:MAG: hypothetical protein WBE08_08960 [Methyloceanibacter sp.]